MKTIVIHAAKDLRIEDHAPETPGPGQVGIRLAAGGIHGQISVCFRRNERR